MYRIGNSIILTGVFLDDCPVYWINFIRYIRNVEGAYKNDEVEQMLRKYLDEYHCKCIINTVRVMVIKFDTKEDMNFFIMKWTLYGC